MNLSTSHVRRMSMIQHSKRRALALARTSAHGVSLLSLLVLSSCSRDNDAAARADQPLANSAHAAVLPLGAGKRILDQCSRSTPWAIRFWTPSLEVVAALEQRLPSFLDSIAVRHPAMRDGVREGRYYRQYVGIIRWNGERSVYINGFDRRYIDILNDARSRYPPTGANPSADTLRWRVSPVSVCDGGQMFFGLEYNPVTQTFRRFRTNASAD
jgi:hypothetical protein